MKTYPIKQRVICDHTQTVLKYTKYFKPGNGIEE